MNKVREWLQSEPVRLYLYGVLVPLLALLVAIGVITADLVPLVLALAAAVFGVPAAENLRKRVTSPKTLDRDYTPLA